MSESNSPQFDCRSQAVDQWLSELPLGSVGKTAEQLYKALCDINRQTLKASVRFETLEKFRENIDYVTDSMRKHFSGLTYPMPERIIMIASASKSLYENMANGYRKVFYELQKQSFLFVDKKMLAFAVHRAIVYLHRCLLITYEMYSAYHRDYWEHLHELYQYAEVHKLTKTVISDPYLKIKKKSTIENEYIRACLVLLAEPYQLRTGEIEQVNANIERWYEYAKIEHFNKAEEVLEAGVTIVELDKDMPPQITGKVPVTSDIQSIRKINLEKFIEKLVELNEKLIQELKRSTTHVNHSEISVSLLQRLISKWSKRTKRRYPRQQSFKKVNVTVGLHNTHQQLMYEQYINEQSNKKDSMDGFKKASYEAIDINNVNTDRGDIWSTVYNWANENNSNTIENNENQQDEISDCRVKQDNWTLLNESANGFALMTVEKENHRLQVGEIVSMQRPGSKHREIGIVRWLKSYSDTGVEVGCLLIAPSAVPIGLVSYHSDTSDKIVNRGLLLPVMPIINQPERILTFSKSFKADSEITINVPGEDNFDAKLSVCLADNGTVSQFNFVRQLSDKLSEHHDDDSFDSGIFADVWGNI